ncbi:MAG: alpha/beta hydrolase, partial [Actinobacteria bacterium]|nr:alpha/beta hydrolase [Actinomycetota bacterium]
MQPTAEVQEFLDLINSLDMPPLDEQPLETARAGYAQLCVQPGPDVASCVDIDVTGGPHGPFTVRHYRGIDTDDRPGCLVWIHGGGFVIGDLETADSTCRVLANAAGISVISVDYHLAPEHPYPAAIDDVMTALDWVVASGDELGIDASLLAVGGDSAGGNLAAVACQLARAAGHPDIAFQLLVYPAVDLAGDHESRHTNAEGYLLTNANMIWFGRQYLAGRDPATPRVSPLLAADLTRLPPAMVVTAEFDPLR